MHFPPTSRLLSIITSRDECATSLSVFKASYSTHSTTSAYRAPSTPLRHNNKRPSDDNRHVRERELDALTDMFISLCQQHDYFRSKAMEQMLVQEEENYGEKGRSDRESPSHARNRHFVEMLLGVDKESQRNAFMMGRSVINMCVADYLYAHFPNLKHDQLVATLLQFTRPAHINTVARESLHLHTFMQGSKELLSIEKSDFDNFLQSTLFRMVGAIHLQYGLFDAREFVVEHIIKHSVDISPFLESFDPQNELKELVKSGVMRQHIGKHIIFSNKAMGHHGPFKVQVLANTDVLGEAVAQTVKLGEMKAAQDALNRYYAEYHDNLTPIQREMAGQNTPKGTQE